MDELIELLWIKDGSKHNERQAQRVPGFDERDLWIVIPWV
jgi:hypothetical protein